MGRSSAQVQHHMDMNRTRLSLPIGISSTVRRKPILSTPYTAARLAPDPLLIALSSLIKVIVMEPDVSYRARDAHRCTRHFSNQQVHSVVSSLRSDRLIRQRKGNKELDGRGWVLTGPATDILYGKREDKESQQLIDAWKSSWASAELLSVVDLNAVLKRSQSEAIVDCVGRGDFSVLRSLTADNDEEREEAKEEAKEDVEQSGMEVEAKEGAAASDAQDQSPVRVRERGEKLEVFVEAVDRKATASDLASPTVHLLSVGWPLTAKRDAEITVVDLSPAQLDHPQPMVDAAPDIDSALVAEEEAMTDVPVESLVNDSLLVQLLLDEPQTVAEVDDDLGDEENEALTAVTDRVVHLLTEAEGAGLSRDDLVASMVEDGSGASVLLDEALRLATRYLRAFRVLSYSEERFVARPFVDRWAFPGSREEDGSDGEASAVTAHPWRLMDGTVNAGAWTQLYEEVLKSVREWPGVKEERLRAMFPVLTPMEVTHVLDTLILDDLVCRRRWSQRRENGGKEEAAVEQSEEGGEAAEEVVCCYFPLVHSARR